MVDRLTRLNIIRIFSILGLLFSGIALFVVLLTHSEVKNTALFGYSWLRLIGVGFICIAMLLFGWIIIQIRKMSEASISIKIDHWLNRPRLYQLLFFGALFTFMVGLILLFSLTKNLDVAISAITFRLAPFAGWLTGLSFLVLFTLVLLRPKPQLISPSALTFLLVILIAGAWFNIQLWGTDDPTTDDIYSVFAEGKRLLEGDNPYERVLLGDLKENRDYATYFPISYYLSSGTQIAGLREFLQWISVWQVICLLFNLNIVILIFFIPYLENIPVLAVCATLFWLFNRWTLLVSMSVDIDFLPIFLLVLSLSIYPRHKTISFLLFGLSLGIKHISIFLIPLFLIWVWNNDHPHALKQVVTAGVKIAIIPVLASLPFILWNWRGFFLSLLFSATRSPTADLDALSLDALFGWTGLPAKIPLLIVFLSIYMLAWKNKLKPYTGTLLVLATVVAFNSVLFPSYIAWVIPFIPLAACELITAIGGTTPDSA